MLTCPSPLPISFSMSVANAWPEKLSATVNAVQDFRKDFMVDSPIGSDRSGRRHDPLPANVIRILGVRKSIYQKCDIGFIDRCLLSVSRSDSGGITPRLAPNRDRRGPRRSSH